jgi:large conductance mechanosensitive channel
MPDSDRSNGTANADAVADEESSLLGHVRNSQSHVRRFWRGFIDFAMQGNMLGIAFGLM